MSDELLEIQTLSRGEQLFENWRRRGGFWLAPLAFAAVWLWPLPELSPEAHRLAAIMAAVVVLWITEALASPRSRPCSARRPAWYCGWRPPRKFSPRSRIR